MSRTMQATNSKPYQLWLNDQDRSSSLLAQRGMEISLPPGQRAPDDVRTEQARFQHDAAIPSRLRDERHRSFGSHSNPEVTQYQNLNNSVLHDNSTKPLLTSTAYTIPNVNNVARPATPALGSRNKTTQTTDYDNDPDKTQQEDKLSPSSSKSQGSVYSQPGMDEEFRKSAGSNNNTHPYPDTTTPRLAHPYDQQNTRASASHWSFSDDEKDEKKARDRSVGRWRADKRGSRFTERGGSSTGSHRRQTSEDNNRSSTPKPKTNIHFSTDTDTDTHLYPKPLIIRKQKHCPAPLPLTTSIPKQRQSFFANIKETLNLGIDELISPRKQHFNTPISGTFPPTNTAFPLSSGGSNSNSMPPPPRPAPMGDGDGDRSGSYSRGNSGSGIGDGDDNTQHRSSLQQVQNRKPQSGLFASTTDTATRQNIIHTSSRKRSGPSTPFPLPQPHSQPNSNSNSNHNSSPNSHPSRQPPPPPPPPKRKSSTPFLGTFSAVETLQRGNENLKGAVKKARWKVNIKSSDERRRERLKKAIVVVGITD